jgi:alpha-glucuronidase
MEKTLDYRSVRVPYEVGDIITASTFDNKVRRVFVEKKHEDIKNWLPGFNGYIVDENNEKVISDKEPVDVWGYHYQVLKVEKSSVL